MTDACIVCEGVNGERYAGASPNSSDQFVCRACQKQPMPQLRAHLERGRNAGFTFERAWPWALERVRWPHDTDERKAWKRLLGLEPDHEAPESQRLTAARIKASWCRAYEQLPAASADQRFGDLEPVAA